MQKNMDTENKTYQVKKAPKFLKGEDLGLLSLIMGLTIGLVVGMSFYIKYNADLYVVAKTYDETISGVPVLLMLILSFIAILFYFIKYLVIETFKDIRDCRLKQQGLPLENKLGRSGIIGFALLFILLVGIAWMILGSDSSDNINFILKTIDK